MLTGRSGRPIPLQESRDVVAVFMTQEGAEEAANDLLKRYRDTYESYQTYDWAFVETPTWSREG